MRMINGGDKNERPSMEDFFNPKPDTATLVCTNTAATPLTYGGLKHHLGKTSEQSRGGKLKEQAEETKNSRWNPTAAQLLALEEKYRCGIRTPTTDQIQQITSQLRRFGKIEGKNVFYWFQNHKARERKIRRRRQGQQKHKNTGHESLNSLKESGPRRTVLGLHQTNNLVPHYSNCSDHHAEGPVSVNGAAIAESGTYGWSEFQERELQLMKSSSLGMHAVWKNMDLSSSTPAHHLTSAVTTAASKFSSFEEHSSLLKPAKTTAHANHDGEIREIQTLQLFPLCSDDDRNLPIRTIKTTFTPGQFFEFLPLKN